MPFSFRGIKRKSPQILMICGFLTTVEGFLVGVAGFEPATSWSQTRRDDRATLHPVYIAILRGCKYTTKND